MHFILKVLLPYTLLITGVAYAADGGLSKARSNHDGLWVQVFQSCEVMSNSTPLPNEQVHTFLCSEAVGEATAMNVRISSSAETIQFKDPNVIPNVLVWNDTETVYKGSGNLEVDGGKGKCFSEVRFETDTKGQVQDDCEVELSGYKVKVRNISSVKLD